MAMILLQTYCCNTNHKVLAFLKLVYILSLPHYATDFYGTSNVDCNQSARNQGNIANHYIGISKSRH